MTYRTAPLSPPPAPAKRWTVRGWPFTPALIWPTVAGGIVRVAALGWTRPVRLYCAFALAALLVWVLVFVRRRVVPRSPAS